jgi:hypothetical protein
MLYFLDCLSELFLESPDGPRGSSLIDDLTRLGINKH